MPACSLSPSIRRFASRFFALASCSILLAPSAFARAAQSADVSAEEILDPPAPPRAPGNEEMLCCFFSFVAAVFLLSLLFSWVDFKQKGQPAQGGEGDSSREQFREKAQVLAIGFGMCLFGAVWSGVRV